MEETEEGRHDAIAKGSIQGPESRVEWGGLYLAGWGSTGLTGGSDI